MINYNELIPVIIIGLVCGLITAYDKLRKVGKVEESKEEKVDDDLIIVNFYDFIKATISSCFISIFIFWITSIGTDNYQLRLGITGLISIWGIDKAISILERLRKAR